MDGQNTAIVGATGAVGGELLSLLEERSFPVAALRLMASKRSAGTRLLFKGETVEVEELETADPCGIDVAFFCAGAKRSRAFARSFTDAGACVIDNSNAFRRTPDVPLVVPEINGDVLRNSPSNLIANPNCSTIIALLPLAELQNVFGLSKVLVTTFQAVSGAGGAALEEMDEQVKTAYEGTEARVSSFPRPIIHNLIPWIGDVDGSGFCEEEIKIAFESRKILGLPALDISATTVRVPVRRCHSMSIWARLETEADSETVKSALMAAPGIRVPDKPPCPAETENTDPVFVGRIRRDPCDKKAFWMWAVSDQLRKGASLNAIQIAETIRSTARWD